jgi:hypothetical protein
MTNAPDAASLRIHNTFGYAKAWAQQPFGQMLLRVKQGFYKN